MMHNKSRAIALCVILLFIGVAVAPCINQSVVKASIDDDLIEVTSKACGITGYQDTTVKLTREQYQDLEQYLVEFRARLNQTTTREEAVPLFKEAVLELNKYGLLPRGMSVEMAQRLVTSVTNNLVPISLFDSVIKTRSDSVNDSGNRFCLISGETNETWFEGPMTVLSYRLFNIFLSGANGLIFPFLGFLSYFGFLLFTSYSSKNRVDVMYRINYGGVYSEHELIPRKLYSSGWINTYGINGQKLWEGEMQGTLPIEGTRTPGMISYTEHYPGVTGFTGITIKQGSGIVFYIGSALWVKIGPERPT